MVYVAGMLNCGEVNDTFFFRVPGIRLKAGRQVSCEQHTGWRAETKFSHFVDLVFSQHIFWMSEMNWVELK